jgi:DNA-binding MarR family transcriptional regulator
LSELTRAAVRFHQGEPNHLVTRLTDDALFRCPFVMMTEVGAIYVDNAEAERLRAYLLKGGFLWADDFWGDYAWQIWQREIRKVLPAAEYPIVDLPFDHPIYRTQFVLKVGVPQISSINFWL